MNLIINPMGISVINKHIRKDDNLFCRFNEIKKTDIENFHADDKDVKEFVNSYVNLIKQKVGASKDISAELNSLEQMQRDNYIQINPESDLIYLLSTHSISCLIATEINRTLIQDKLGFLESNISTKILEGIDVGDAKKFVKTGVDNTFAILNEILLTNKSIEKVIINITCGFKAMIPLITVFNERIIGDFKKKCIICYLYENRESILSFQIDGEDIISATENIERKTNVKSNGCM
ncbi:MAG: hypothetical protein RAO94_00720 [Candidatus Stygibacter australis]|nr:hypothetical protein [Candidatus Stygibacter australis]